MLVSSGLQAMIERSATAVLAWRLGRSAYSDAQSCFQRRSAPTNIHQKQRQKRETQLLKTPLLRLQSGVPNEDSMCLCGRTGERSRIVTVALALAAPSAIWNHNLQAAVVEVLHTKLARRLCVLLGCAIGLCSS